MNEAQEKEKRRLRNRRKRAVKKLAKIKGPAKTLSYKQARNLRTKSKQG